MAVLDVLKTTIEFSPKLGVRDLPLLDAARQSTVPGLYVVGDLADAPIIKAALNQGHEVAARVAESLEGKPAEGCDVEVVVVGAGPAGVGAALALHDKGVRYTVLERELPFNTIQNFPRAKQIFSEPRGVQTRGNLWFDDASKEDLLARWEQALADHALHIEQPVEVLDIQRQRSGGFVVTARRRQASTTEGTEYALRCRRVILATGRRGEVRRLDVPGERLPHVAYGFKDAAAFAGRRVVVIGGGDSAVEAACACAEAGAQVTLVYRGESLYRARADNLRRLEALRRAGTLGLELGTRPVEITAADVVFDRGGEPLRLPADDVLVLIGTRLPTAFLRRLGVRMAGQMDALRGLWIAAFALLTYAFYVLKSRKDLYPFGSGEPLAFMHDALEADLGFRTVDAGFWGTTIYALVILALGVRAYRKYPSATQKRRYISLIAFQWAFLFAVPELLAPAVIKVSGSVPDLLARPWKLYAFSVPWPLSIWSVIDAPGWGVQRASTAVAWIGIGLAVAFVAIPLYVRRHGQRFCSYLCGCGGLAETLGDFWRHLAPRGSTSYKAEWFGRAILFLAAPVTLLILNDAWGFVAKDALYSSKAFAQQWYGLMVDFWLASVLGVAAYPYLGNRVWCRFFCPLRAWMEVLAKRFARVTIASNERCIGCGECTRYCQMGIQVQVFAQQQRDLDNSNSSCIQCGICVQVCPMEVLSVTYDRDFASEQKPAPLAPAQGPR